MAWFYLLTAGALEVAATTVFRYTEGLSRIVPTVTFFAIGLASFYFLNRSLAGVQLGTAYAVWTGIGAGGTAALGILAYGEGAAPARIALLAGIVACTVGLKFVSAH
jgi:quaternary ammonium compound-resistance protein SugE